MKYNSLYSSAHPTSIEYLQWLGFQRKNFLRLFAVANVFATIVVLVAERLENSRNTTVSAQLGVTCVIQETVLVTQLVQHIVTATPLLTPEATAASVQKNAPQPHDRMDVYLTLII